MSILFKLRAMGPNTAPWTDREILFGQYLKEIGHSYRKVAAVLGRGRTATYNTIWKDK